jgi:hypothetical protein
VQHDNHLVIAAYTVEAIQGFIYRRAREHNLDTPYLDTIYSFLRAYQPINSIKIWGVKIVFTCTSINKALNRFDFKRLLMHITTLCISNLLKSKRFKALFIDVHVNTILTPHILRYVLNASLRSLICAYIFC